MNRAKIIVMEGTDGSGKETQSKNIEEYLKSKKVKVKKFSFPNYESPTGKIVGGPYLGKEEICDSYFDETSAGVDPIVSSLYFAADRRYNFLNIIEKELYKNDVIILDRYTTSNMGHQAGKARSTKELNHVLNLIETLEFDLCELPRPDIVFFLHMPFEAAKELRKGRKHGDGNENDENHLKNAEKAYIKIAKKYKWKYINCIKTKTYESIDDIKSIDQIKDEIIKKLDKLLKEDVKDIKKLTRF